ncbi:hypothetical protein LPTSP4_22220 [Leptospira ryugenii]|uniref:Uncharacterized protein n=1 Tax=Leptospira ryugenii TaxID=1917863 RepID=A0A2P2E1C8_9LEPT|nr:hypothetical protein [Leptospira ryugenii]GBF50695.1 hypothetical protein LPTSP4_22220 [Leptospira ryugenii]
MGDSANYYSLKVAIRDEGTMTYVMFAALLDPIEVKTVKYEGVASGTPHSLLPVRSTFQDYCNRTQRVIYKGDQLKNITKSLQEVLKSSFSSESTLTEILHYIDHNMVDRLEFIVSQIHTKIAGKSNPLIEIHYEIIGKGDVQKTTVDEDEIARKEAASQNIVPSSSSFVIPIDKQLIQFRFQLSPVNGTPLTDLKPGDTVYIRPLPGDPITDGIISSLDLKNEDGMIKQIPAKIVNISSSKNISEVVIKINEQVYGKIIEEENSVKIKTFDAQAGAVPVLTSVASATESSKSGGIHKKDPGDVSHIMPFIWILGLLAIGMFAIFFFI